MIWRCLISLLGLAWPSFALAQGPFGTSSVTSDKTEDIAITIYTDNLALITERRRIYLPPGKSVVAFKGVSDMMIPQSAVLREFSGFTLERNFDFDLITPGALFEGATGEIVTIFRTNPATGSVEEKQARIVSGSSGVILEIDGKYEALKCAGLPERTVFDRVPDGLNPQPTLSIQVSVEEAGEQEVILSYLASGFGWSADYRLDLNDDEKTGSLIGWLTVSNQTEVSVENAATAIIAGELQRLYETRAETGSAKGFSARCWPRGSSKTGTRYFDSRARKEMPPAPMMMRSMASPEMEMADSIMVSGARKEGKAQLEEFGDYKLYRPPERTTVAAYQEKQLLFLANPEVELEKIHTFDLYQPEDYAGAIVPATVVYHLDNSREGKLGLPLPEGTMRVMTKSDGGRLFYLGQDSVDNLAVDLPAEFAISSAPDIQMETKPATRKAVNLANGRYEQRLTVVHTFFNASPDAVEVALKVGEDFYTPIKINNSSLPLDKSSATPKWQFKLPAESKKELTYTAAWIE